MINQLEVFNHEKFGQIRMIKYEGKVLFVGIDVAKALEYVRPSQAISDNCKGIRKLRIPSQGGMQTTNMIPEGDVYRLIVKAADQSRNPEIKAKAEKFETWVFDEVLPTINKHGMYAREDLLNDPDLLIQVATQLKMERIARKQAEAEQMRLEAEIKEAQPKVAFANAVEASPTSILIRELAKIIKQNGYDIGGTRLSSWMRNNGYLVKKRGTDYNMPTQRAMDMGLFEIKEALITVGRNIEIKRTTKVTGKGQVYFVNKFIKSNN